MTARRTRSPIGTPAPRKRAAAYDRFCIDVHCAPAIEGDPWRVRRLVLPIRRGRI